MDVCDAENGSDLDVDSVPGSSRSVAWLQGSCEHLSEKDNIRARLQTFVNWLGAVLPMQLAIAGFVYVGPGDRTECLSCGLNVFGWTESDAPLDVHRKRSPHCSFLDKWFPVKSKASIVQEPPFNVDNIFDYTRAKYLAFVTFAQRLATFDVWPLKEDIQSPTNMSMAGFLYIGSADRSRCFNCGITLRDWDTDDDPFEAHSKWSPTCEYIQKVQELRAKRKEIPSSSNTETNFTYPSSSSQPSPSSSSHHPYSSQPCSSSPDPSSSSSSTSSRWKYSVQVETVLAMGYNEELIQRAISKRRQTQEDDFPDAVSLFCAVEALILVT